MIKREQVLIEALPYIREFHDSIMVFKIGGSIMSNREILEDFIQDMILLRYIGIHPVVVHGGGPEINEAMERFGKKAEFIGGLRVTDQETLEIARMVLVGKVNAEMVSLIGKYGGKGVGLSGKDGQLIMARKKAPVQVGGEIVDLGFVGEVDRINPEILMITAGKGYIPVISPIAVDSEGHSFNVNADTAAGAIANALRAKKLISITDVEGVMRDAKDPSTVITRFPAQDFRRLVAEGVIKGGMIPKVEACVKAVEGGVEKAHIIDGRIPHAIILELLTDAGIGTMVSNS
ncbi:MAG TPA: acetylglutamate kinase [Methanotrichaceae archaeon]|nr:MAG: Acetylglutamate/acetylaminoadipate kinase [Methanosaeta sp. PtaU1.Bin028]HOT07740.1 acetylglutamate kinase [Methanotrichaceae archaeon]HQF16961.1 acetylglutamate kinase [Methanotrichaceae archaeon]HQI91581.1 acetylglutamate kinase [Methanotrichaceae archaeon]HQJ28924.1 acetylglutamate kinase [Methanotrichaceae archaeon]